MHTAYMEQYAHASPLRHRNASLKTAFSVTVLILCLLLDSMAVFVWITVSMAAVSVILGKVRLRDYIRLLGIPLFFIIFGGAALFFATGDVWQALHVTLRAIGAVSSFYFLTLSTPVDKIMAVLQKCHVPPVLISLMYLTYRFIFVLTDIWQSMYIAAQSRLGYRDYRTSLGTFAGIGGNLLMLSMKRGDDCYNAIQSRGYEGTIHFLESDRKCRPGEALAALFYIAMTVGIRRFCG